MLIENISTDCLRSPKDSNSPQLHSGPVVKTLASIVVGMDLIPGQGTKITCAAFLKNMNSKNT